MRHVKLLQILFFGILIAPFIVLSTNFLLTEYSIIKDFVFVIDDVWIHLEFAKNIVSGNGFSFNPHEPIAGSTAPLYTLLLALMYIISKNLVFNVYFISMTLTILIIYCSYKLTFLLTKNIFFSLLTSFLISINPWITWSALSGMEIALASFLLTAAVYFYIKYRSAQNIKKYLPTIFLAFACLVRPETYSLVLLYFLLEFITALTKFIHHKNTFTITDFLVKTFLAAIIVLPYGLFSYETTGSFFPNTYAAKVGDLGIQGMLKNQTSFNILLKTSLELIVLYTSDFLGALKQINLTSYFILFPSIAIYLYRAYREKNLKFLFLPGIFIMFPAMVGLLVPTDRVSWPWNRHMLYLTPLFIILTSSAAMYIFKKSNSVIVAVLVALILFFNIYDLESSIAHTKKFFIERTVAMNYEHIATAKWIRDNISYREKIAASDIGVIGFYTDNMIIDTEGLINPHIGKFKYRRGSIEKDQEIYDYLAKNKPAYLVKFYWAYPSLSPQEFPIVKQFGSFIVYKTPW